MRLKFEYTYDLLLQDKKTQTTRVPADKWFDWYKDHPKSGKHVLAEGPNPTLPKCEIRITECFKTTLGVVATNPQHFIREGYRTGDEFVDTWCRIHKGFDPTLEVCVLRFVRI